MKTLEAKSWFERNSKITILLIIFSILIIIVVAFEKFFEYQNRKNLINADYHVRYIRLRESPPLMSTYTWPSKREMECSDTLEYKRYRFRVDRNGFIFPSEKYSKPDNTIVFLGGSTTECQFNQEENRFPYLVGCLLEKKLGQKINSYNGGTSGNNSMHTLFCLMAKVLPLNPKVVVMMENINDMVFLLYDESYYTQNPSTSIIVNEDYSALGLIRIFMKKLIPNIYQAALQRIDIRRYVQRAMYGDEFAYISKGKVISEEDKIKVLKEFGVNLQLFIDICKIKGIAPVLMTMASRLKDNPDKIILNETKQLRVDISYQNFKELFDKMNETIRRKARENGILVIDLARHIPQDRDYIYDSVHLTDRGCIKAAEIISSNLIPLLSKAN